MHRGDGERTLPDEEVRWCKEEAGICGGEDRAVSNYARRKSLTSS